MLSQTKTLENVHCRNQDITQSDYIQIISFICYAVILNYKYCFPRYVFLSISLSKNYVWFKKYIMDKNKVLLNFMLKFCDDKFLPQIYLLVHIHPCTFFSFLKGIGKSVNNHLPFSLLRIRRNVLNCLNFL